MLARVVGGGLVFVELFQVVARRGREAELVSDEIIKDGAGVAADGAVRFIRDDEVKIRGRKERLIFVVEQQRLNGRHHNFRPPPIVPILLCPRILSAAAQSWTSKAKAESLAVLVFPFAMQIGAIVRLKIRGVNSRLR